MKSEEADLFCKIDEKAAIFRTLYCAKPLLDLFACSHF
jgi:hypothetical protein